MMIHILLVQTLQLHLQYVLICLVNVTLTAKTSLHTSQFARPMAVAVYYTVVGLEKIWQRTENRETNYRGPSIAVRIECRVEQTNKFNTVYKINYTLFYNNMLYKKVRLRWDQN